MATRNEIRETAATDDLKTAAESAIQKLVKVESSLPIDHALPPNDVFQIRSSKRVSTTALVIAADIVRGDPKRFPDLDPAVMEDAAVYDNSLTGVAIQARQLADHLDKSMMKRRWPAAQQAMVLYDMLKSLGRIPANETIREKVKLLKQEMGVTRRTKKAAKKDGGVEATSKSSEPNGSEAPKG